MASRVIGIDLGTSSSLVAILENGKPKLIPLRDGRTSMPSLIVVTKERSIFVGHEAENEARKYSEQNLLVASLKRSMGTKKEFGPHGATMPVQVLAAIILSELKICAEAYLGEPVEKAVIAVPASFNLSQRQITKEAALIAGLEPLRIVNEATASILAMANQVEGKVIVADLGGGTFDVSTVDFGGHVFQVVATNGDGNLGGDDFTEELLKLILSKSADCFDPTFLRSDPVTFQRITDAAEEAKKQLSTYCATEISVPYVRTRNGSYNSLVCEITRAEFQIACTPLFDRIEKIIDGVALKSGEWKAPRPFPATPYIVPVRPKQTWIGRLFGRKVVYPVPIVAQPPPVAALVWLIGNASRVPEITRRVNRRYRAWTPSGHSDLKTPVAMGAARIAAVLEGSEKDSLLIDVTPNTLSIETDGGVSTPMIRRNTSIPASHSHVFTTVQDNQTSITVRIQEGERPMSKDNASIGMLRIENLPPARAGVPKIEVRFDIDASGILRVTATDLATSRKSTLKCSELVLSERRLNEYHGLVRDWTRKRRQS